MTTGNWTVISTAEFDSTLKKTVHNIHKLIIKELHDFGNEPARISKVMFVSDQGVNIKAALRSYKWMPCTAHIINIVLKHILDVKENTPTYMRNVSDIIAKCNDIKVTEFLMPFKTASEEMEGDTYPTIQLVMLWFLN